MTASPMFIIEDDDHFRETFIDVMSLRGIEVTGARTGDEAIKALRLSQPSVIIMDVQLPDVHGFELCRKVKRLENQKDTPVIFVSASTRYADPRDPSPSPSRSCGTRSRSCSGRTTTDQQVKEKSPQGKPRGLFSF